MEEFRRGKNCHIYLLNKIGDMMSIHVLKLKKLLTTVQAAFLHTDKPAE